MKLIDTHCHLDLDQFKNDLDDVISRAVDAGVVRIITPGIDLVSTKKCLEIAVKGSTESVKHAGTYILKREDVEHTVVFTNGVFDILHIGHLKLLRHAKTLGNRLIVGINSDSSVKRLKGNLRPINGQNTRKESLLELGFVDDVIVFEEDTPLESITKLEPDIIVKGGDYTFDTVVGNHLAKVVIFPTVEGHSTTRIIDEDINYRS